MMYSIWDETHRIASQLHIERESIRKPYVV
jgi:hypothetical protein